MVLALSPVTATAAPLRRETFAAELKLDEGTAARVTAKLVLNPTASPGANASTGSMARLPGGTYTMGETKKTVTVKPFLMDETEVTTTAYAACVKAGKCRPAHATVDWPDIKEADRTKWSLYCNQEKADRVNHPVNCVDWNQATAYCAWAGKRLPTEEEWEWAARGAERGATYPWGNEAPGSQLCWNGEGNDLGKGQRKSTCPAGSYPAGNTPHGLKDLAGNVWEWTSSTPDASDASRRVIRGGSGSNVNPGFVSAAIRDRFPPVLRASNLGFRCARTP